MCAACRLYKIESEVENLVSELPSNTATSTKDRIIKVIATLQEIIDNPRKFMNQGRN